MNRGWSHKAGITEDERISPETGVGLMEDRRYRCEVSTTRFILIEKRHVSTRGNGNISWKRHIFFSQHHLHKGG